MRLVFVGYRWIIRENSQVKYMFRKQPPLRGFYKSLSYSCENNVDDVEKNITGSDGSIAPYYDQQMHSKWTAKRSDAH